MPLLVLPGRYTEDSISLWRAATEAGWNVQRIHGWNFPPELRHGEPRVYGESFFCRAAAAALGLTLIEPPLEWLAGLAPEWVKRPVEFLSFEEARRLPGPAFFK